MIKEYASEFGRGVDYGMNRAMKITIQDPSLHTERPKDIRYPRSFGIGEKIGKLCAGAIYGFFFDVATLGALPLYNRHKNRKRIL